MMGMAGPELVPVDQVKFWSSKHPSTNRYIGRTAPYTQYNAKAGQFYSKYVSCRLNKRVAQTGGPKRTVTDGLNPEIFSKLLCALLAHTHLCYDEPHQGVMRWDIWQQGQE